MSYDGEEHEAIRVAPWIAEVRPCTLEFLEIIKDFSPSDLFVVKRMLEQLRRIAEQDGPEAALAAIERAFPKTCVANAVIAASYKC